MQQTKIGHFMKTIYKTIPKGTNFLSDVMDELPYNAYINKGVTGCGGTTLALTNDIPYVIAVHSVAMVKNKVQQLPHVVGVTSETTDEELQGAFFKNAKKYIVTYDSLPRLCKYINPQDYNLLVDEVQVLIRYAGVFKIKVCNDLINRTQNFKTVSYLTATPTPLEYLPEAMQDLDYVEYKWEDAVKPIVRHQHINKQFNVNVISYILDKYFNTNTDIFVFYNSVSNVATTIKKLMKADDTITMSNINIFFAESDDNTNMFHKHLGKSFRYAVPLKGSERRINFVSSMGFEGIDFYNKAVSVLVVSDAKYKSMRYDVSIDIPQIVGRFRNVPTCPIDFIWNVYTDQAKMTKEEFIAKINVKTQEILDAIEVIDRTKNETIATGVRLHIKIDQLPYGYVDDDRSIKYNQYAYSSLMSSYSAMHCDYYVLNKNHDIEENAVGMMQRANDIFALDDTLEIPKLSPKHAKNLDTNYSFNKLAKEYCALMRKLDEEPEERFDTLDEIDDLLLYSDTLQKYHEVLKPSNLVTACFNMKVLDEMYDDIMVIRKLKDNPLKLELNKVYSLGFIKDRLTKLYIDNQITKKVKTTDAKNWYDYKPSTILNDGKIENGIKIIGIK